MGSGPLPTAWNLRGTAIPYSHNWYQFSSDHAGGVMFAYADGSVRNVTWTVDSLVFRFVSGMADGKTASAN